MKKKPNNNGVAEESFLEIDEYNLEKEWVGQPSLYHKYAKKLALARKRVDEAKAGLELCEAQLDKTIRSNPKKFNIEKISEGAIQKVLVTQDEYQEALELLHEARYNEAVISAGVTALDHRKKALENLVQLWVKDFYSDPRARGDLKEEMDEMASKSLRKRTVGRK